MSDCTDKSGKVKYTGTYTVLRDLYALDIQYKYYTDTVLRYSYAFSNPSTDLEHAPLMLSIILARS